MIKLETSIEYITYLMHFILLNFLTFAKMLFYYKIFELIRYDSRFEVCFFEQILLTGWVGVIFLKKLYEILL